MGNVMPFAPIWLFRQVVKTSVRKTDVAGSNPARALYAQAHGLKDSLVLSGLSKVSLCEEYGTSP